MTTASSFALSLEAAHCEVNHRAANRDRGRTRLGTGS